MSSRRGITLRCQELYDEVHSKENLVSEVFRPDHWNRSLVARGSLTVWIDHAVIKDWGQRQLSGKRGAQCLYSDAAIVMALTFKSVYHQTLRGTQGLLGSVFQLMGLHELTIPDYSTLCRRAKKLEVRLRQATSNDAVHLVVDSTGCKIFGEGEWKVRKHGWTKRRTWRTIHLGVDSDSGQIKGAVMTTNDVGDSEVVSELIDGVDEQIRQFSGDGAYDTRNCYDHLKRRAAKQGIPVKVTVPPRKNARISKHGNCRGEPLARDENIRRIRKVGRAEWKRETDYHRRSIAETTMFRFKTIFGDRLQSRCFENQATEVFIRCRALNGLLPLNWTLS